MRITSKYLLILVICLAMVSFGVEPYHNGFDCNDLSIRQPFIELEISINQLLMFAILIPVLIIIISEYLSNNGNKSDLNTRIRYKLLVFNFGIIGNFLLVMVTKNLFGRLRPHTIEFCNAGHYCSEGQNNGFIDMFECRNERHPYLVRNVRHSFFSGHASIAIYSGVYVILYLRTKLSPKLKLIKYLTISLYILIALVSLYPGFSQWKNYWHFASDVLTGYTVGVLSAILVFKILDCDNDRENTNSTNNYISLQKLLTTSAVVLR